MSQKPLVLPDIRTRAGACVAQWRDADGYEHGEAQSFARGLLRVFGVTRLTAAVHAGVEEPVHRLSAPPPLPSLALV